MSLDATDEVDIVGSDQTFVHWTQLVLSMLLNITYPSRRKKGVETGGKSRSNVNRLLSGCQVMHVAVTSSKHASVLQNMSFRSSRNIKAIYERRNHCSCYMTNQSTALDSYRTTLFPSSSKSSWFHHILRDRPYSLHVANTFQGHPSN